MSSEELELLKAGVTAATKEALKPFTDIWDCIFLPRLQGMRDRARDAEELRRIENAFRLKERYDQLIAERGIKARPIVPKLLFPIVEGAMIEDDEDLQDRYAALLASASDDSLGTGVLPSFVDVLRQLTAIEVQFLDSLFDKASTTMSKNQYPQSPAFATSVQLLSESGLKKEYVQLGVTRYKHWSITRAEYSANKHEIDLDSAEFALVLDDLKRLGLVESEVLLKPPAFPHQPFQDELERWEGFRLSPYGFQFAMVCRVPKQRSDGDACDGSDH